MTAEGTASVPPLVTALDILVQQVALADPDARTLLASCPYCRNHLLYLLDTEPGQPPERIAQVIATRIRALAEGLVHEYGHARQDPPPADSDVPQIRGILW